MCVTVETRAGEKVKHESKAEPFKINGCSREKCFPGQSGGGGQCEKNGAGYIVQCLTCLQAGKVSYYEGESGKNGFRRGLDHLDALGLEDAKNTLWKHC